MKYKVGDIIKVKVTNIENYGIFVQTMDGYNGLIHLSEISYKYVSNIRNFVFPDEEIYAQIISIDEKKNQLTFSIKSIDYRILKKKGMVMESPNGFGNLKNMLPVWINEKLKELNQK